jgi:hypothetical protein
MYSLYESVSKLLQAHIMHSYPAAYTLIAEHMNEFLNSINL